MRFHPLHSIGQTLLSYVQRHRFTAALASISATLLLVAAPLAVNAQCIGSGTGWTCSGSVGATSLTGTAGDNAYTFLSGTTGTVTITTGGGYDTLDFRNFLSGITVQMSNSGPQTVVSGLILILTDFNTPGQSYNVWGGSGWDNLIGGAGNDALAGYDGGDSIVGGSGDDTLYGLIGDDELYGGTGNDVINGGDGDDYITGEDGNDTLLGLKGDDQINGGAGNDKLYGGDGNDKLYGGNDLDLIYGEAGNDEAYGEEGYDRIFGSAGDDIVSGGTDGTGSHDIYISSSTNDITVDLNITTAQNTGEGNDTITGIEDVFTGSGNDTLIGDNNDNIFNGGAGTDTLNGNGGDDSLIGGADSDLLTGGAGQDFFQGDADSDTRMDTVAADCVGDTLTTTEIDKCASSVAPAPKPVVSAAPANTSEQCITPTTRISFNARGMVEIFSDYANTPNGMIITEIPLHSIRNVTDDERAANAWVPLTYKDSEYAPGWSVGLYWHDSHYGVQIFKDGQLFDDTTAFCGWF